MTGYRLLRPFGTIKIARLVSYLTLIRSLRLAFARVFGSKVRSLGPFCYAGLQPCASTGPRVARLEVLGGPTGDRPSDALHGGKSNVHLIEAEEMLLSRTGAGDFLVAIENIVDEA